MTNNHSILISLTGWIESGIELYNFHHFHLHPLAVPLWVFPRMITQSCKDLRAYSARFGVLCACWKKRTHFVRQSFVMRWMRVWVFFFMCVSVWVRRTWFDPKSLDSLEMPRLICSPFFNSINCSYSTHSKYHDANFNFIIRVDIRNATELQLSINSSPSPVRSLFSALTVFFPPT